MVLVMGCRERLLHSLPFAVVTLIAPSLAQAVLLRQLINLDDSLFVECGIALDRTLDRADGIRCQLCVILRLDAQLRQMRRHADLLKEALHGQDAFARGALGMMEIHLHAKYAVRQLSKARKIVLHFVQRPGREQHGQTGTVCNLIAERGQLMLELMHREQTLAAAAGVIVM